MNIEITPTGPHKNFESIKQFDENGIECWRARDLFPLLGYSTWQAFEEVILRARRSALNSGQLIENHFSQLTKLVQVGSNTKREIKDWKLDRYACYLIAQNGDSKIPEIARAQTYFAVQTRKQEISDSLPNLEKRIFIRNEVAKQNKKLFKTAKASGVSNFGSFNDAGYRGLYNASLSEIEKRKGVRKGALLDHAGSTELAANLFRITQTDDKLSQENIRGQERANQVHFSIGGKVRQTIKDIGGTLPENLKMEKNIKNVKKEIKIAKKTPTKRLKG